MRTSHLASFLLLSSSLALAACGGAVASPSDGQSSGSSGTSGSTSPSDPSGSGSSAGSTGPGSSGRPHSNPQQIICTPGAYVFCRCADRSESTKQCDPSGTSLSECACDPDALPPPPPDCLYPPNTNPPGCPAVYSHSYQGQPCDTPDLVCSYPGAGDGDAKGCASTAGLLCRAAPGSAPSWVAVQ